MPSMPSERTDGVLRDILHHIDLATQFVKGFNLEAFKLDIRTVYAVTRRLEIMCEAERRCAAESKARNPQSAWRQMVGGGYVCRHDYEDVLAQLVWDTVQRALQPVRAVIQEEIAR